MAAILGLMATRYDVSRVPLQGTSVAKRCPVRAQNDVLQPGEPVPVEASLERRFARGLEYEAEILDVLREAHPDAVFVSGVDGAARETATLEAASGDARLIIGGRLPADVDGRRVGEPDLLVRAPSDGWRPVDVKHHLTLATRRPKRPGLEARCSELTAPAFEDAQPDEALDRRRHRDDMLQLAHYQRMLEAAGLAAGDGRLGGIIGVERRVVWHDLDEPLWRTPSITEGTKQRSTMEVYDFEFGFRLDVMAVAQDHLADPSVELLVVPVRIGECDTCPWFDCCMPVLEEGSGDVSLLPRIGWQEWSVHRERGIGDRAALAGLDVATARIVAAGIDPEALAEAEDATSLEDVLPAAHIKKLASLGIESVTDLPPIDPRTASYAGSGMASLPEQIDLARAALGPAPVYRRRGVEEIVVPRGDVEVDVDMENVEDGCYLWGTYASDRAGTGLVEAGYRAFVTWERLGSDAEVDNFRAFWTWLTDLRAATEARGLDFRAYCYSQGAENQHLRAQGAAAGVLDDIEAFIDSEAWIDLLPVFKDQCITGHGNGLKIVAPLLGFAWRVDDAGGLDSMVRYDEATGASGATRDAARAWLLTYNADDVEATLAVRERLDRDGTAFPAIEDAPASGSQG